MSQVLTRPRLVRHTDASTWDLRDRLKVNPRTGFARSRAGLSWTGVREYETPQGTLRVLRRWEQVGAPGHKRTLRELGTPEGHPTEDRDLTPATSDLLAGITSAQIDEEAVDGFLRPVADFTVFDPAVFAKMMPLAQWLEYVAQYPEFAQGVVRPPGAPRTGTSLGYNALWMSPFVEAEFTSERDGAIVGAWQGPDRRTYEYDVEHVIDPDCEIVKRLEREQEFDPETLGGQHCAIALRAGMGRGGDQTELLRVNDSQWIGADPTRGRVQFQVPCATRVNDMKWVVSASGDLPLEEGEQAWDGDEAAASIFDGAGWPDAPDPAAAKLGFLIHDSDAPDEKGSYKLPIARRGEDGMLRVPKSGIDAAASFLSKTDAPTEVLDRAQAVLDQYNAKFDRAQPARDTGDDDMTTPKQAIVIGVGSSRATRDFMTKQGIAIPADLTLTLDMPDAGVLAPMVAQLQEIAAAMAEALGTAEDKGAEMAGEMEGMKEKLADMPTVEEAKKSLEEAQAALEAAKTAEAEAKKTGDEAKKAFDAALETANKTIAALNVELEPVRVATLDSFRTELVRCGLPGASAKDCKDAPALRRAFVVAHVSDSYASAEQTDVDSTFKGAMAMAKKHAAKTGDNADDAKKKGAAGYTPGEGLKVLPSPSTRDNKTGADAGDTGDHTPETTDNAAASLAAQVL